MRILVIDDNPADQFLIREAAESLASSPQLTFAMDGEHALAILRHQLQACPEQLPQLILLDIHMPGASGLEVLSVLKGDGPLSLIPVVMLTTSRLPEDVNLAFRLHASAFMTKEPNFLTFQRQFHALIAFWRETLFPAAS